MRNWLSQLNQSVFGRMLLYVVIPTLLIFALVILLGILATFDGLRQAAEERLRIEASLNAARVEDRLERAILSAQRMAEAQVAGLFGDRQASLELARLVLQNSPEFTGCYFGYEPNADQQDATSVGKLPPEAMDETGRFIPYWFVVPNQVRTIKLEPLVNLETSLYYQGAKTAFSSTRKAAPLVTEPYVYQDKLIVEQVYPIVMNGKFMGIAGLDFALADVASGTAAEGRTRPDGLVPDQLSGTIHRGDHRPSGGRSRRHGRAADDPGGRQLGLRGSVRGFAGRSQDSATEM